MSDVEEKISVEEFYKFLMFANPNSSGKKPKLVWSIRDSNPRITVYTNDPADNKIRYGMISAPMNPEIFLSFIELFIKVINGENNNKYKIECWGAYKDANGVQQDKTLQSEVWFGKDDQGICWISLIAPGRPKIRFNFSVSEYHKIVKHDGNTLSESEGSILQAFATVKGLRDIYISKMNTIKPNKQFDKDKPYNNSSTKTSISNQVIEDIPF